MRVKLFLIFLLCICAACSRKPPVPERIVLEAQEGAVPGTVTGVWQEPIVNTVRVPGQIDPQGTYYRAPHQTVVEIYPGRVQEVQYPVDERSNGQTGQEE